MRKILSLSLIVLIPLGFVNCSPTFRGASHASQPASIDPLGTDLSLQSVGTVVQGTPISTVSGIWNNDNSGMFSGDKAIDGNMGTRWASNFAGNAATWIHLDYGNVRLFKYVEIVWETAGSYKIEVSLDGITYHKAASGIAATNSTSSTDLTGNQWGGLYGRYLRVSPDKSPAEESQYRSIYEVRLQNVPPSTVNLNCAIAGEPLAPTCDYKTLANGDAYAPSFLLYRYGGLFDHNFVFHPTGAWSSSGTAFTRLTQLDTVASCMERCRTYSGAGSATRNCALVVSPNGAATECLVLTSGTNSACAANLRFKAVPAVTSSYSRSVGIRCQ